MVPPGWASARDRRPRGHGRPSLASLRGSCLGQRARNRRPRICWHLAPHPSGGASRTVSVCGVAVLALFGHQGVGPRPGPRPWLAPRAQHRPGLVRSGPWHGPRPSQRSRRPWPRLPRLRSFAYFPCPGYVWLFFNILSVFIAFSLHISPFCTIILDKGLAPRAPGPLPGPGLYGGSHGQHRRSFLHGPGPL